MSLTVPQITGPPTPHSSLGTLYGYAMPTTGPWQSHHFIKVAEDTSAKTVDFDLQYVGVAGVPNDVSTIRFNYGTGVWSDVHTADDPDFFSLTANGTYTSSLTITADNTDIHLNRGNGQYLGYFTLSGWTPPPPPGNQGSLGQNPPVVEWLFPGRACGLTTYVRVSHVFGISPAQTYTLHNDTGQIGTILVGTAAGANASVGFTIAEGIFVVKSNGVPIASKTFSCTTRRKVCCNFW